MMSLCNCDNYFRKASICHSYSSDIVVNPPDDDMCMFANNKVLHASNNAFNVNRDVPHDELLVHLKYATGVDVHLKLQLRTVFWQTGCQLL